MDKIIKLVCLLCYSNISFQYPKHTSRIPSTQVNRYSLCNLNSAPQFFFSFNFSISSLCYLRSFMFLFSNFNAPFPQNFLTPITPTPTPIFVFVLVFSVFYLPIWHYSVAPIFFLISPPFPNFPPFSVFILFYFSKPLY